jgi:Flp pilus assembly pilin Flp
MDTLKRLLRDRSEATAIGYCLIAAIVLILSFVTINPLVHG